MYVKTTYSSDPTRLLRRGVVEEAVSQHCSDCTPGNAGVMIHKIDCCMLDLLAYHEKAAEEEREQGFKPWAAAAAILARAGSFGERQPEWAAMQEPEVVRQERSLSLKSHPAQD